VLQSIAHQKSALSSVQSYIDTESAAIHSLSAQLEELKAVLQRYKATNKELVEEVSGLEKELAQEGLLSQQLMEVEREEQRSAQRSEELERELALVLQHQETHVQSQRARKESLEKRVHSMLATHIAREKEQR